MACIQILNGHLYRERRVCLDGVLIFRTDKLRGGHVAGACYNAHGGRVTRAVFNLLSVCQVVFVPDGRTEVDVVIGRGERCDLTRFFGCLAVLLEPSLNQGTIER